MAAKAKKIAFDEDQLFLLLDAMDGHDIHMHADGNEGEIKKFEKLYRRVLKAYQGLYAENREGQLCN